jgi:hypothetical protein
MSALRTGIAIFCVASLALAAEYVWDKTRTTNPVDMAWPDGASHWRTPDFTLNVTTFYDVGLTYKAHFPWKISACIDHLVSAKHPIDCGEPLYNDPIQITVFETKPDGSAPSKVEFIQFDEALERWYYKDEYRREFGGFKGQAGRRYSLSVTAQSSPGTIAKLRPRIWASTSPGWNEEQGAYVLLRVFGILLGFFVSICLMIYGIFENWRARRRKRLEASKIK